MKVLVFTMAFNAEKTIERTINSILGQTFANFEYYVLDNAATDRTGAIIHKFATIDERVKPIRLNKNDPTNGGALFSLLAVASDADYIVWCDADDTYSPTFLEKITAFAQENRLDIAACGYDCIDGCTSQLLKRRVSANDFIVDKELFSRDFIQYRGFTTTLWGKLYSIPFLKSITAHATVIGSNCDHVYFGESIWLLDLFRQSQRIGVIHDPMYQWYQYPTSQSHTNLLFNIKEYPNYWRALKGYLEYYGPISKINEDFLYAVYMSLVDEGTTFTFQSKLPVDEKLQILWQIFHEPLWAETLAREADPQFHNLAGRQAYVAQMKERIYALASTPHQREMAEAAVQELDRPIAQSLVPSR